MLPVASAGASLNTAISNGKFHGTTSPHTPTGSRRVNAWNSPPALRVMDTSTVRPSSFVAHPA